MASNGDSNREDIPISIWRCSDSKVSLPSFLPPEYCNYYGVGSVVIRGLK